MHFQALGAIIDIKIIKECVQYIIISTFLPLLN